jgi:hypothetical protein
MFDLLSTVELTASAALVVAAFAVAFGPDTRTRLRLTAALAAWFVVVVVLAATQALHYETGPGAPALGLAVVLPIGLLAIALLRIPTLRTGLDQAPLVLLTAVHAVRILGVSFVLLYDDGRLPAPFAPVAGWGDIAIGLTALPVAWLVASRGPAWRPVLLTWNALGLADLATAVTLGVLSTPGPLHLIRNEPATGLMATLPWLIIPAFLVPLLVTTHLAIFYRLAYAGSPVVSKGSHNGLSDIRTVNATT